MLILSSRVTVCSGLHDKTANSSDLGFVEFKEHTYSQNSKEEDQDHCVICLEIFKKGDCLLQHIFSRSCGQYHRFHKKCLIRWFQRKNSCVLCRKLVSNRDDFRWVRNPRASFLKRIFRSFFSLLSSHSEFINYIWRFEFNEQEYLRCIEHDGVNYL